MTKVYIGCFGSGFGHASRMLEIAGSLSDDGWKVEFSSSGEVASMIQKLGYACNKLPLADVRYSESGAFSFRDTLVASPAILARTSRQFSLEIGNMIRFGPQVVLSDSALPTVLAGKFLGLPTFTVLNQLNLTSAHEGERRRSRFLSVGISAGMGELWEFSDEILLPDLPPPYTISERNLWGSTVSKTRYIGFLCPTSDEEPDQAAKEFLSDPRHKVFWQVSGPPRTRGVLVNKALKIAGALSDEFVFVITSGSPTARQEPRRIAGGWYYGWCRIANFYFSRCDVIVSRAGHGTIGQSISASKPSLLIPIPKQPEQQGNAEKAVRLGVAVILDQKDLTPERVREELRGLVGAEMQEKARSIGRLASNFDAREEILKTIRAAVS